MAAKLDKIFDSFSIDSVSNRLFEDKVVLQSNFTPSTILHRDKQIEQVASILAPALSGEKTSNLFVYGKSGSGKTLSIHYVKNEILKRIGKNGDKTGNGNGLKIEYLNCKLKKVSDTEYRILAELIKKLGGSVPATGLPTDQVYNKFIELIEKEKQLLILILDEIDYAVKKISDNFLYNLTRLNSELSKTQIGIVGISNDLRFLDALDPRVRSSLSEEEIVFPPYNALQLQDILRERAGKAFKQGIVEEGVIAKCAALAAREHGDARRALDLLRIAGEIAEREHSKKICLKHIDIANEKIENDKFLDVIQTSTKQAQLTLFAIMLLEQIRNKKINNKEDNTGRIKKSEDEKIFTGDIYNLYRELCEKTKTEWLTQRRIGDLIAEFDMLGLINARVISKGRHGRTREIRLAMPEKIMERAKNILNESLNL